MFSLTICFCIFTSKLMPLVPFWVTCRAANRNLTKLQVWAANRPPWHTTLNRDKTRPVGSPWELELSTLDIGDVPKKCHSNKCELCVYSRLRSPLCLWWKDYYKATCVFARFSQTQRWPLKKTPRINPEMSISIEVTRITIGPQKNRGDPTEVEQQDLGTSRPLTVVLVVPNDGSPGTGRKWQAK